MSKIIISCFLVLLSSFHACHARNFQRLRNDADQISQHAMTTKNSEEGMLNVSGRVFTQSETESSLANDDKLEKNKTMLDKTGSSDEPEKHTEAKGGDIKFLATPRKKPLTQVSWKVPHEKRGEKEPGFNLDYLPPRTHPPVHN